MATDVNPYDALRRIEELAQFKPGADRYDILETMGRIQMIAWQTLNREPKPSLEKAA